MMELEKKNESLETRIDYFSKKNDDLVKELDRMKERNSQLELRYGKTQNKMK
jgi:chaperonin cofactor prefoldin